MNPEFSQYTVPEVIKKYSMARNSLAHETGSTLSFKSIDVARRFDAMMGNIAGYVFANPIPFNRLPSQIAVVTNPVVAAEILTAQEFDSLDVDTPVQKTSDFFKGKFISTTIQRDQWLRERSSLKTEYSPTHVQKIAIEAHESVRDGILEMAEQNTLPEDWIKIVTLRTMFDLLSSKRVPLAEATRAMQSHTSFLKHSIVPLLSGLYPQSFGTVVKGTVLRPYEELISYLISEVKSSNDQVMFKHILSNLGAGEDDITIENVVRTLMGCFNGTPTYIQSILFALAQHPEYQEAVHDGDTELLKRIMYEVGRMTPPVPIATRRVKKDITFNEVTLKENDILVIGIYAFGGEKFVEDAHTFNPERPGLDKMAHIQGGTAGIFSYGPRGCVAKHFAFMLAQQATSAIVEQYTICCQNNPYPILGGVGLRFSEPLKFMLTDRSTGKKIEAVTHN